MATPSPSVSPPSSSSPSASSTPTTSPTPSTTPTSSTSTSTSTNAATSTQPTSASTTSATSAASSTQSSSSSAGVSTSALTTAQVITSGGTVQTITSTSFVISTTTPAPQDNTSSHNSFFSNTGAVAGVFTVVGLIVFGLVLALVINAVRRHRAQRFDRDVAEAAAEAAAMSRSPFDDYSYNNSGGNGGGSGGYGYSDNSHGTYQLPSLPPQNGAYGMTEMSQYDPYAPAAAPLAASAVARSRTRKESEPGTPGIAGVGAGTLAREPSKRAPYHAFAGPGSQPHDIQVSNGTFRSQRSNQNVLEAAGLAATSMAAVTSNTNLGNRASGSYVTRQPSDAAQTTLSGRSKYGSTSSGGHPAALQPGYPVESYYPHRNDSLSPDPFAGYPPATPVPSQPLPNPHDATTPSPSLPGNQSEHNEDHGDLGSPTALYSEEQRMSYQDDTDYSQGHRVLRVANE